MNQRDQKSLCLESNIKKSVDGKTKRPWQWNSRTGRIHTVLLGTIVQYISHPIVVDEVEDNSCCILKRLFWAFKPCIVEFNYRKTIVQVWCELILRLHILWWHFVYEFLFFGRIWWEIQRFTLDTNLTK